MAAIKAGNKVEATRLINKISDVELSKIDDEGHTILIDLLEKGFDKLAEIIIPKMTDQSINCCTIKGNNTALIWASYKGFEQIVKMLLPKMNIEIIDKSAFDKKTALSFAIERKHVKIAEIIKFYRLVKLIEAGQPSEAKTLIEEMNSQELDRFDDNGNTALLLAAQHNMTEVCEKLVSKMTSQAIWHTNKEGVNASRIEYGLTGILIPKIKFDLNVQGSLQFMNSALDLLEQTFFHTPNDPHFYFKKGNILCALDKKVDAIKCYEIALKLDSNYGEQIADVINFYSEPLDAKEDTNSPKFVINTIAYVPDKDDTMAGDSSDEECDHRFSYQNQTDGKRYYYLPQQLNHLSFFKTHTTQIKKGKSSKSDELGSFKGRELNIQQNDTLPSTVVQPFLDKLEFQGFEKADQHKLDSTVSVSIGLNRPNSLSTRKNNVLKNELNSKLESNISVKKFGFYWEHNWYDPQGRYVNYETVRKFYKQLKRYDKDIGTQKAEEFRENNEKLFDYQTKEGTAVPYQALREYVKNHPSTTSLVQKLKTQSPSSDIYFSFIDSDTANFNGIYSAYMRIHKNYTTECKKIPTVMSTGYEFRGEGASYPYQVGSQLDRAIRIETAKYIPLGVYYPEPNFCVLLLSNPVLVRAGINLQLIPLYLPESFISTDSDLKKKGNAESVALLRQVKNRQDATFIFSDDNPLITEIPARTKQTKQKSNKVFSLQFINKGKPTGDDIAALKFNQSHFDEENWVNNLYMNRSFDLKTLRYETTGKALGWKKSFVGPAKNFLNSIFIEQDLSFLFKSVGPEIFIKIISAVQSVRTIIEKFKLTGTIDKETVVRFENIETNKDLITTVIKSGANLVAKSIFEKHLKNQNQPQGLDNKIAKALKIDLNAIETLKIILKSNDTVTLQNNKNASTEWWKYNILKDVDKNHPELSFTTSGNENELQAYIAEHVIKGNFLKHLIALNVHAIDKDFSANNHWVGLYVEKIGDNYQVTYVDPMGQSIDPTISKTLAASLINMVPNINQPILDQGIQYTEILKNENGIFFTEDSNQDDCGPFTRFLLLSLLKYKELTFIQKLDSAQSKSLGQKLRKLFDANKDFDEIYIKVQNILKYGGTKAAFEHKINEVEKILIQQKSELELKLQKEVEAREALEKSTFEKQQKLSEEIATLNLALEKATHEKTIIYSQINEAGKYMKQAMELPIFQDQQNPYNIIVEENKPQKVYNLDETSEYLDPADIVRQMVGQIDLSSDESSS